MSKRVLVCNRGEIAIRVAKAVKELGHIPVGFWTDNEPNAPHLEYCDIWVHLPGSDNTSTYLNMDLILSKIDEYKIEAVHPGYGFLSENTVFAKKLEDKGIIFIGPHAEHLAHLLSWAHQQKMKIPQMLEMPFYHPVIEEGLRTGLSDVNDQLSL